MENVFHMAMLWEKVVVTAREFLTEVKINDCAELNEPFFQAKLMEFDWDLSFAAACIFAEIVWKKALMGRGTNEMRQLDRLFGPSPIATHANFRGCRAFKTGNAPQKGAIVVWKRGNSWQGHMAIVTDVSEDMQNFDTIEGRILIGSGPFFLQVEERKGKQIGLPFRSDKLNIVGFIYPPDQEIR